MSERVAVEVDGEIIQVPAWSQKADWKQTDGQIAARFRVSRNTVMRVRHALRIPSRHRTASGGVASIHLPHAKTGEPVVAPEWAANVNWNRGDSDIARDVGVSRVRVNLVRLRLGYRRNTEVTDEQRQERRQFIQDHAATLTVKELSEQTGYSIGRVRELLSELGLRAKPAARLATTTRYDWQKVDWERQSNKEIAAMLGCPPQTVANYRHYHRLPKGPRARRGS